MSDALLALIDRLDQSRVIVAGDAMLDIFTGGTSTRMMPEAEHAPVILQEKDSVCVFGGAGNAATNITALKAACDLICLTGDDPERSRMLTLADRHGFSHDGFIADASRPTIVKERIISNGMHVARLDREKTHEADETVRQSLLAYFDACLEEAGAVILADYCKGTLSDTVIRAMIAAAQSKNIPVLIDSKRMDFAIFEGALLAKPNMKELTERVGFFYLDDARAVEEAARTLIKKSGIQNMIASRSKHGMMLVTDEMAFSFPATARHVAEVTGAGDTVMAVTAMAMAAGAALDDAVCLANIAAGVAVEKDNTSTITRRELKDAVVRCDDERKQA